MPPMLMQHDKDPAKVILDNIGSLDGYDIMHNEVLVGIYERPTVTKSGIHLSDQTVGEDQHQGKAALILKKGPLAFVSDRHYDFKDMNVEAGEWVAIWVGDGRKIKINGQLCRLVEDRYVRMKIPAPDTVF